MDISKIEFRVAGADQDVTSTRRCDLSQDHSTRNYWNLSHWSHLPLVEVQLLATECSLATLLNPICHAHFIYTYIYIYICIDISVYGLYQFNVFIVGP